MDTDADEDRRPAGAHPLARVGDGRPRLRGLRGGRGAAALIAVLALAGAPTAQEPELADVVSELHGRLAVGISGDGARALSALVVERLPTAAGDDWGTLVWAGMDLLLAWDGAWGSRDELLGCLREGVARVDIPYWTAELLSTEAWMAIGEGRLEAARDVLRRALEANGEALAAEADAGTRAFLRYQADDLRLTLAQILGELWDDAGMERELDRVEARLEKVPDEELGPDELATLTRATGLRSVLALDRGLLDVALHHADRELARAERCLEAFGDPAPRMGALLRRADVYTLTGRYARGEDAARRLLDAPSDPGIRALALAHVATTRWKRALEAGEDLGARAALEEALAHPAQQGLVRLRLLLDLAELHLTHGELPEAGESLVRARAVLADSNARAAGPEAAWLASLEGRLALAAEAPREELEARLGELRAAWREFLASWARRPARPGGLGFLQLWTRANVLGGLVRLAVEVEGAQAGFEHLLEAQALGTLARLAGVGTPSFDEVRATLLADGAGLVVYLSAADASHVFAVDADGVVHALLPARREIAALVDQLHRELAAPGSLERCERVAAAVAAELLPAGVARRAATWRHVRVVGASLVRDLPFEVLPLGPPVEGVRPTWGTARAVSHLPSVPVGVWLARRAEADRRTFERDLTLVAATEANAFAKKSSEEELGAIPLDAEDERRLVAPFAAARVRRALGPDATCAALDGDALLTHVLAHGIFVADEPLRERRAALVLAPTEDDPRGLLYCEDVEDLPVSPVVFLSSCGTARGPARLGDDGVEHMGGAFLWAGADAVVLSSRELRLGPTLELAAVFQAELAGGAGVAEAMRRARVRVARLGAEAEDGTARSEWRHPHGHSLLRVVGLGERAPFRDRR